MAIPLPADGHVSYKMCAHSFHHSLSSGLDRRLDIRRILGEKMLPTLDRLIKSDSRHLRLL
ncbi:MAG TPA: hypothetical protein VLE46_15995 [Nitrospira sp.]|nr:hypothetical protein [Nitrospira sp.]